MGPSSAGCSYFVDVGAVSHTPMVPVILLISLDLSVQFLFVPHAVLPNKPLPTHSQSINMSGE